MCVCVRAKVQSLNPFSLRRSQKDPNKQQRPFLMYSSVIVEEGPVNSAQSTLDGLSRKATVGPNNHIEFRTLSVTWISLQATKRNEQRTWHASKQSVPTVELYSQRTSGRSQLFRNTTTCANSVQTHSKLMRLGTPL